MALSVRAVNLEEMRRQLAYPCHIRSEAQLIQTRQIRDSNIDFFSLSFYTF